MLLFVIYQNYVKKFTIMAKSTGKGTEISAYGEFGLIEHLTKDFPVRNRDTKKGVGDDAAVISPRNRQMVVTTDLLLEGVHFDLAYTPLKHLGYKAVVVNLSDVYAMNAEPRQITVSVGVSSRFRVEHLEELYEGIRLACDHYGVDLVGGDTSASSSGMVISITALGRAAREELVYRDGAKENDVICVTGDLGAAYMGLQILKRENKLFQQDPQIQPDLSKYPYIVGRQLKPEARQDIIALLKEKGVRPTAMIDISDGLSSDLLHICHNSQTGCRIYQEKIPIDTETSSTAEEMNIEPLIAALSGGEDYELLFTVSTRDMDKLTSIPQITAIGFITPAAEKRLLVTPSGAETEVTAQGWNAFGRMNDER